MPKDLLQALTFSIDVNRPDTMSLVASRIENDRESQIEPTGRDWSTCRRSVASLAARISLMRYPNRQSPRLLDPCNRCALSLSLQYCGKARAFVRGSRRGRRD